MPVEKVEVVLGDTELPLGPVSGGSWATASVVPAVFAAADNAITSCCRSRQRRRIAFRETKAGRLGDSKTDESLLKLMDLAEAFRSRTY